MNATRSREREWFSTTCTRNPVPLSVERDERIAADFFLLLLHLLLFFLLVSLPPLGSLHIPFSFGGSVSTIVPARTQKTFHGKRRRSVNTGVVVRAGLLISAHGKFSLCAVPCAPSAIMRRLYILLHLYVAPLHGAVHRGLIATLPSILRPF